MHPDSTSQLIGRREEIVLCWEPSWFAPPSPALENSPISCTSLSWLRGVYVGKRPLIHCGKSLGALQQEQRSLSHLALPWAGPEQHGARQRHCEKAERIPSLATIAQQPDAPTLLPATSDKWKPERSGARHVKIFPKPALTPPDFKVMPLLPSWAVGMARGSLQEPGVWRLFYSQLPSASPFYPAAELNGRAVI